jgi:hypothetical protein
MPLLELGDDAEGCRLPGVYRALLAKDCEQFAGPDPRLVLEMDPTEWEHLKGQGRREAAALLERQLEAGEPLIVPRWRLGGHNIPTPAGVPMFADRSIKWFEVSADDVVSPAAAPPTDPR